MTTNHLARRAQTRYQRRAAGVSYHDRQLPSPPSVQLCFPDDQLAHLPEDRPPFTWPAGAQVPRHGDVIYLTSTSAWMVEMVIHELIPGGVRVEIWIKWIGAAHCRRDPQCALNH